MHAPILWLPDWQPDWRPDGRPGGPGAGPADAWPGPPPHPQATPVLQHDWARPLRGDWLMQLEQAVLGAQAPVRLLAQGLGCHLVAAWAAHSRQTARILDARLWAPLDVSQPALQARLPSWSSIVRQRLPFPSRVLASPDPTVCAVETAQAWAADWGADWGGLLHPDAAAHATTH